MKDVIKLSELLKNIAVYYNFATTEEKEKITRIIFSELSISENTFNYKLQKGFQPFKDRFVALGVPRGSQLEPICEGIRGI